jgi:hypothetical protein
VRAIAILAAGLVVIVTAIMLLIAPPHYFIVYGGARAVAGSLNDGYTSKVMRHFGGLFYASPDVGEGGATVTIRLDDGTTKTCGFGYFTSGDWQWHFMSLGDCDGRHR